MKKIDFIGRSKVWMGISIAIFTIVFGSLVIKGLNFSVDFTGGNLLTVKSNKPFEVGAVRDIIKPLKLSKAVIQPVGKDSVMIRYGGQTNLKFKNNVVKELSKKYKVVDVQFEQVGPDWGEQITTSALWALILSITALLLYISIRFEFKMAVSAIIALIHDVGFTIGIYSLVGRDVAPATIAALLTILGYSLYDTIVVFHKINENKKTMVKESYAAMANRSLNQVVVRSLNTSITSMIPVLAILFFGGDTLKDFAFALALGMLSGVYSSLVIATPLLVFWKEKTEPYFANLKRKYA